MSTDGIQTWTPGQEAKAAAGVLGTGVVWWLMWRTLVEAPGWLQLILGAAGSVLMGRVCWDVYAQLWRGEPVWGTGVAIGPTFTIDADQLGIDTADQFAKALGLYVWNALNVVPFLDVTDTLNWAEPVEGYSTATGVLLLLYKGLVLAPLLAAARAAWRGRKAA